LFICGERHWSDFAGLMAAYAAPDKDGLDVLAISQWRLVRNRWEHRQSKGDSRRLNPVQRSTSHIIQFIAFISIGTRPFRGSRYDIGFLLFHHYRNRRLRLAEVIISSE